MPGGKEDDLSGIPKLQGVCNVKITIFQCYPGYFQQDTWNESVFGGA